MAKKAGSKKESTTKKSASIAGVKKSGDKLPPSGFAKNHELYLITRIDTDLLVKEIQTHYDKFGDVRTTFFEDNNGDTVLKVQLFKNKQAKLPVIELFDSWADEVVAPDLAHFWGPGKITHFSFFYGVHEFLYERRSLEVLTFDEATAKLCFSHLAQVNSELRANSEAECLRSSWCKYSQFNLLIYRLLKLGEAKFLLDYMKRTDLDEKASLNMGISRAMEYLYMVGAGGGDYADNIFHHRGQEIFEKMFLENGLELKLTDVQRIAALEAMIDNGGGNEFVEAALSALRKRKRK